MRVAGYDIPAPALLKARRWLERRGDLEKSDLVSYLLSVASKTNDGSLRGRAYRLSGALIQAWKRKGLVVKVPRTRKWQVVR